MNTQNNQLFKTISKQESKKQLSIVTETIAFGSKHSNSFTVADLWNIQKKRKSIQQRKYMS